MDAQLVQVIANALAARDLEHSGHQEAEDFYTDFAETAIRAYDKFNTTPRAHYEYVEGLQFL
jgi:hypothetical protein